MIAQKKLRQLPEVAQALVAPGKGILAADESFATIEKRFEVIDLFSTEENRLAYHELLFTTPGIGEFISGVIMFDETIRQKASDGIPFPELLNRQGIIPGIKVDQGTESFPQSPQEKITKGLEGLRERLEEYKTLGARFAKWRAVVTIGDGIPTDDCLKQNAKQLAEYARICQEAGLVPIVEPEVLMDGSHDIARCEAVTTQTLKTVFAALSANGVALGGTLLKPNMVIPGKASAVPATPEEIAEATLRTFRKVVPKEIPGIVFLSGGQTPEEATQNLNEINRQAIADPWLLTFSYGRALQDPVLRAWQGKAENVTAAQEIFFKRARLNSLARQGKYYPSMEN